MLKKSPYHHGKENILIKIIRTLYIKYLDELYLPKGTTVRYTQDNNRKPSRKGMGTIMISSSSPNRRGLQEEYLFEEFGFKKN